MYTRSICIFLVFLCARELLSVNFSVGVPSSFFDGIHSLLEGGVEWRSFQVSSPARALRFRELVKNSALAEFVRTTSKASF